jgi:hypothetical protein
MVLMDIQESLLTDVYALLTEDVTLQELMGGVVRLYPVWAPPDAEFPYLVHRIDMRIQTDWSPVSACTYLLDIWSHSPGAREILNIREAIMGLLDGQDSSTDETSDYHVWIQADGFVPEPDEDIWHYACQFNLRWLKDAQIGAVLKR